MARARKAPARKGSAKKAVVRKARPSKSSAKAAKTAKAGARRATPAAAAGTARKTARRATKTASATAAKSTRRTGRAGTAAKVRSVAPARRAGRRAAAAGPASGAAVAAVVVPREVERVALTLDALFLQTNINGPAPTSAEVIRFRANPALASTDPQLFGTVSNLMVNGWFPGFGRPDDDERRRLWVTLRETLERPPKDNPGGWDGASKVITLAIKGDKP